MAVRPDGEGELLGHVRVDAGRGPRDGLRPGPPEQRPRARARHREAALGAPLPRAERRAERARGGRRAGLRRDRLGCVRALRRHGPPAVEPASDERHRAVRRHRARRLGRARLHEHRRLPAGRARRDLRARRRHRCRALEVRHDPGAVAASARGRRRWALVSGLGRRRGAALRGELEPAALGRIARAPERRRLPRPGALHELAARARRAQRPAALARPGDAARHSRLRLRGDADPGDGRGQGARLRSRQGGTGDRLGPRDATAALGDPRRAAPKRPRPAAAPPRDRLPRPVRRSPDADGLRGGPACSCRSSTCAGGGAPPAASR